MPPFVAWPAFYRDFAQRFSQGQHITLVGGTGSGKTTLGRQLILLRAYVVVMATKVRDDSLYRPLMDQGFVIQKTFQPVTDNQTGMPKEPRVILKPELQGTGKRALANQADAFGDAVEEVFRFGYWCVFADEIRYLTDNLRLDTEFETLWLQGRSLGVSLVCGTQRPVSIPLESFSQATHLFLFRENDKRNIDRMSEFSGGDNDLVRYVIPRLPPHETLYIDTRSGQMARTKVTIS
jgi:hypothetical protein